MNKSLYVFSVKNQSFLFKFYLLISFFWFIKMLFGYFYYHFYIIFAACCSFSIYCSAILVSLGCRFVYSRYCCSFDKFQLLVQYRYCCNFLPVLLVDLVKFLLLICALFLCCLHPVLLLICAFLYLFFKSRFLINDYF